MRVNEPLKKFGRFGIASKGIVYILAGGLTCAAALGMGGKGSTGKKQTLSFIYEQPFGKALLALMGIGLIGYTVYRLIIAFKYDSDKSEWMIWGKKIAYAASGLFYASIAFTALKMVFTSSGNSGGGDSSKQNVIQELLGSTAGQVVLFAIAAILVGRAGFQFYQAWSGKFSKRLKTIQINPKYKSLIEYTGVFGYASRGVVILIIAYMFFKAVLTHDPSKAKGMSESFQLIQGNFGPLVLAIISGGLCAYGIFMLIKAYFCYLPELE